MVDWEKEYNKLKIDYDDLIDAHSVLLEDWNECKEYIDIQKKRIDDLESTVSDLEFEISSWEEENAELQDEIDNLKNEIETP